LSRLLNQLTVTIGTGSPDFRNPNGVYMKLMNFRRFDPIYQAQGKSGLTRGNKLELLCANCHRMVHSRRPWLTIDQLSEAKSKRGVDVYRVRAKGSSDLAMPFTMADDVPGANWMGVQFACALAAVVKAMRMPAVRMVVWYMADPGELSLGTKVV
jgi:hypothetical protein